MHKVELGGGFLSVGGFLFLVLSNGHFIFHVRSFSFHPTHAIPSSSMSNVQCSSQWCALLVHILPISFFLSFLSFRQQLKLRTRGVLSLSFSLRITDTKPIQRLTNLLQTKNNIESSHSFRIAIFCDGDDFFQGLLSLEVYVWN